MGRSGRLRLDHVILAIALSFMLIIAMTDFSYGLTKLKWTNRFDGGFGDDRPKALAADSVGNVYVTGLSESGTFYDYATIKYSPSGAAVWTNLYITAGVDQAHGIAVDSTGNVYVTGYNSVACTIKYSAAGVALWTNFYDNAGGTMERAFGIAISPAGDVYVAGYYRNGSNDDDYFTIKYSSAGIALWTNIYDGGSASGDWAYDIAVDSAGNAYVTGIASKANRDYCTIKYTSAGIALWTNFYDGGSIDEAKAVAVDSAGNVYVTGRTRIGLEYDVCTIKYSSGGATLWTRIYNGIVSDNPSEIAVDSDDNVYIAGTTRPIKYSSAGSAIWSNYSGSGLVAYATGIAVATNYNPDRIFLTVSVNNGANQDYFTVGMVPVKPLNFSGTAISTNAIQWSWTCSADDEGGFQLQDEAHSVISSMPANTISYPESGLNPDQKYIRHITVTNALGNVDSDSATNYTLASLPHSFICIETNITSLKLSWQTNIGGCHGFVIQRANDIAGIPQLPWVTKYSSFSTNTASIFEFDNTGLAAGTAYWYRLAGMNGDKVFTSWIENKFVTSGAVGGEPVVEYIKVTNTSGQDYYRDDIIVKIKINDPDSSLVNADIQYKSDSLGISWTPASIKEETTNIAQGEEHQFTWDSAEDIKSKAVPDIVLQIIPDDGVSTGDPKETKPFTVNNVQLADKNDIRVMNTFHNMNEFDCTQIMFKAEESGEVEIIVYDLKSREIRKMFENVALGFNSIKWCFDDDDGKQVASGSYTIYIKGAGVDKYIKIGVYR